MDHPRLRRALELALIVALTIGLVIAVSRADQIREWWTARSCGGQVLYATHRDSDGHTRSTQCRCHPSPDVDALELVCE